MSRLQFRGTIVDLVTPFRNGELDLAGLRLLVEWQIQSSIEGILVCGDAGEAHGLSPDERKAVITAAVEVSRGRVPVLVGIGSNATDKAIALVREAREIGADGVVLVTPYYNKPCQDGVFLHVVKVASSAGLPILLHNRPAATVISLGPQLVERLASLPDIVGLIDCTPDHACALALSPQLRSVLLIYGGDDRNDMLPVLMGAAGRVSWVANVAPRLAVSLHHAAAGGNLQAARAIQTRLRPLLDALQRDHPVSMIKQALAYVFGTAPDVRLPLLPVEEDNLPPLRTALSLVGLSTDLPFLSAVAIATDGGLRHRL